MRLESPYHEGELLVQRRLGEVEEGRRNGRAIGDSILKGALKFISEQALAVIGSIDRAGEVWASLLVGAPGFMKAPSERSLEIDIPLSARNPADPLWNNIVDEPRVGMLIIELGSRRRLRINGRVRSSPERVTLDVVESYPNCPKYIQRRLLATQSESEERPIEEPRQGTSLEAEQQQFIRSADTFFVASAHPERGVDASHRGGKPGFIQVLDERRLRVPDYLGNRMYNTLGNFLVHPRAGLVFLDFERARTLQLVGRPEIQWELGDPGNQTGGTRRFWDFEVERWLESALPRKLQWEFLDHSPHNPGAEVPRESSG